MSRSNPHAMKIAHRTRLGAYRHLAGTYWRYWRNSGFKALPDLRSRAVYVCTTGGTRHFHMGRNKRDQ